jgi:hypothetical protein
MEVVAVRFSHLRVVWGHTYMTAVIVMPMVLAVQLTRVGQPVHQPGGLLCSLSGTSRSSAWCKTMWCRQNEPMPKPVAELIGVHDDSQQSQARRRSIAPLHPSSNPLATKTMHHCSHPCSGVQCGPPTFFPRQQHSVSTFPASTTHHERHEGSGLTASRGNPRLRGNAFTRQV